MKPLNIPTDEIIRQAKDTLELIVSGVKESEEFRDIIDPLITQVISLYTAYACGHKDAQELFAGQSLALKIKLLDFIEGICKVVAESWDEFISCHCDKTKFAVVMDKVIMSFQMSKTSNRDDKTSN